MGTIGPRNDHRRNQTTFPARRLKRMPGRNAFAEQVYAKGTEIVTIDHP
jgi:hypothetical protein